MVNKNKEIKLINVKNKIYNVIDNIFVFLQIFFVKQKGIKDISIILFQFQDNKEYKKPNIGLKKEYNNIKIISYINVRSSNLLNVI